MLVAEVLVLGVPCQGLEAGLDGGKSAAAKNFDYSVKAGIREGFDSNVYLQSETDLANRSSWVTALLGDFSATWSAQPWKARVGYLPEATFYHAESSEDFVAHRAQAEVGYKGTTTSVDVAGTMTVIDGDSEGLIWTGPGGAPATGGPSVRDRRDAAVYRGNIRLTQELGAWRVRPGFTAYHHDFRTVQKSTPGYLNYVDRSEFTVGADLGRSVAPGLPVWVGYRYGEQDQALLLDYPEQYDSRFHRILGGIEGALTPWMKASVSAGPELRTYGDGVPLSFGSKEVVNLFADASVTLTPGKSDSVVVSARQFDQPGFAGRSAYEDLTLDISWRHCLNPRWTLGAGGRAYRTDFFEPVVRDDWVLSVNGFAHYDFTRKIGAEVSYAYEDGETQDPGASGREYERHWVAAGVKVAFR